MQHHPNHCYARNENAAPEAYDLRGVADAYFRARTCHGNGPHHLWLLNVGPCLRLGVHRLLLQRVRVEVRAQGALIMESDPERNSMLSKSLRMNRACK